jgi:DNA-binding beta-propeller fold protein YncE
MNIQTKMRMVNLAFATVSCCLLEAVGVVQARQDAPLTAQKPVVVPGGAGRYDYLVVDSGKHRLLACHTAKKELVVLDLTDETKVTSIPVGTVQGVAVDTKDNKYFVSDSADQKIIVLDRDTFKLIKEIPVTGPADSINYDVKHDLIFAGHDDGTEVWVIDGKTNTIAGSVTVSGPPEWVEYDPATGHVFQNVKTDDTVHVIDPVKRTAVAIWKTTPATGPHGLAIDSKTHRIFTAGKNGILAVLDSRTGKLLGSADIAKGVDQIAIDTVKNRVYCACTEAVSVVDISGNSAKLLNNVPAPKGSHTIAVDPATHSVWIAYADVNDSYLMKYLP